MVPPVSLTIPLGAPVVPDVYRMYKGCSDSTGTHSATSSVAFMRLSKSPYLDGSTSRSRSVPSSSLLYLMSRGKFIAFGSLVHRESASSMIGLYLITLPGSIPALAVIISFG